jgi:hypothetical protein
MENPRISENLKFVLVTAFEIPEGEEQGETHDTTDSAETIDADLGNHG